ncbi:uncharacterized protein LOC110104277 [Dendrobium catenatum]|uniref:uncharacterized protein LOC110104277 n=1 Tax=Dendrobium catenatum TaxID=906689 RepID=UPI00109F76E4|nr:uncharacterized protein LOC110104277 [Dendrobium catenatum]
MGLYRDSNAISWEMAIVYADKDWHARRAVWEDITQHHSVDSPLVVGGDFNCILSQAEKKGERPFSYTAAAGEMGEFMHTNGLDARSRISSRLDRFLISSSILDVFQELRVTHLTRLASDHCPILCSTAEQQRRVPSFWIKFEDAWIGFPKAWQLVADKWKVQDTGSEACKLQRKCNRSLKALYFWSKNKLKTLIQLKDDLDKEIKDLQEVACSPAGLSEVQYEALRYKVQLLNSTLGRLAVWWRQRAKVKWIEEGDDNTRFFHSMASARRRSNLINQIKDPDGNTVSEQADVMGVIHRFFEQKWCSVPVSEIGWPCFDSHMAILADAAERIVRDVTTEEVWAVVRELGPNRAPGRDGVTASFIKAYWSIVGDQVTAACLEFFSTGIMDPGWKDTVVVLLPKIDHPTRPSNFRPIRLASKPHFGGTGCVRSWTFHF